MLHLFCLTTYKTYLQSFIYPTAITTVIRLNYKSKNQSFEK